MQRRSRTSSAAVALALWCCPCLTSAFLPPSLKMLILLNHQSHCNTCRRICQHPYRQICRSSFFPLRKNAALITLPPLPRTGAGGAISTGTCCLLGDWWGVAAWANKNAAGARPCSRAPPAAQHAMQWGFLSCGYPSRSNRKELKSDKSRQAPVCVSSLAP